MQSTAITPIRVSIRSDDLFFREGLRPLLQSDPAFALCDETNRPAGLDTLPVIDVVLVDSRMEGVLGRFSKSEPDQRPFAIFMTVPNDEAAVDALGAGARGVVRKTDAMSDVIRAIRTVHEGSVWAPRHVVVQAWLHHRNESASIEQRLSARESEVVRWVVLGMSNKELALHLGISMATVKAHLTRVFQKLGLNGRGQLVAAYQGTLVTDTRASTSRAIRDTSRAERPPQTARGARTERDWPPTSLPTSAKAAGSS